MGWNKRQTNIFDRIESTLDQKVYDGDEPKQTILKFIEKLYYRALDQELGVTGDEWADLYLTGSLTTYQYSSTSDCDISVFPNYDKIYNDLSLDPDEARKHLIHLSIEHLDGTFLPGTTHPLQFFVVPKGQIPSDLYQPGLRSAYSFDDRQWFVKPEKDRVHDVSVEYPELYARAAAMADKMNQMLDAGDTKAADQMWQEIHRKRQLDQQAGLGDFCLALGTKVLRDDYKWIPIEDIKVGETLVGFDKEVVGGKAIGKQRTFQPAVVRSTTHSILPSFKITTTNGTVIASAKHGWLVRSKKRLIEWRNTEDLKLGDTILRFSEVWGESADPIKAAYLAGIFDGEGHMTKNGRLSFSQKEGNVQTQSQQFLNDLGFDFSCGQSQRRSSDLTYDWAWNTQIYGTVRDTMRFISQIPTVRVGRIDHLWWMGRSITSKNRYAHSEESIATVIDIENIGEHEVIGLGTSTGTLIADGLFSSNSEGNIVYKWFLHQGLFDRIRNELHEYIAHVKWSMPPAAQWEDFADSLEERQVGGDRGEAYFVNDTGLRWRFNHDTLKIVTHLLGTGIIFDVSRGHMQGYGTLAYKILPGASGNMYTFTITINQALSPEAASYSLWHEIQHAFQLVEGRMEPGHASPTQLTPDVWKDYITDPIEVDADEMAAKMQMIEELPVIDEIPITEGSEKEYYEELLQEGWPEDEALDMLTKQDEEISLDEVLKNRQSKTADLWNDKITTKVIYDFDKDRILLGTQATQAELPASKIIGEYEDGIVTLFDADKQWINPTYFRRLWHFSFPERDLKDVYYKRGDESYKLKTIRRRSSWKVASLFEPGDHVIEKAYGQPCIVIDIEDEHHYLVEFWEDGQMRGRAILPENDLEPTGENIPDTLPWSEEEQNYYRTAALQGLPQNAYGPNQHIQGVAQNYMQSNGMAYNPPQDYVKVDLARAKLIADEYEKMEHNPNDEAVRQSYEAMKNETFNQYNHLKNNGYQFEFYPEQDPYPQGPRQALEDLRTNKHLYVYPTSSGFGQEEESQDHPLLEDSGERWGGRPVTHNDIFRAVHDVFGHAKEGVGFRANGEENAWRQHSAMYSDQARPAMTAETRGQNSWVNYGPYGQQNQNADQASTVYADQKAGLLPDWVTQ